MMVQFEPYSRQDDLLPKRSHVLRSSSFTITVRMMVKD